MPVPFGGRNAQIAELNRWLADPNASSNLLITAPAGRGKTALLVRWLSQVNREAWPVAFVPISIRYETNRAAIFYQALAARLAAILEKALPATPADPASFYRDKVIEFLELFHDKDRPCLVVIDGLDEAAGWQVDTSVLPLDPAPGLRIVASARLLAGDRGSADWLRRLGWNARRGLARTLEVPLLDRDGIADVIERMGYPLAPLSSRVDILAELLRLTAGEPLLLELYVTELLEKGDQAARLHAEELRELKPGFADFFKHWWGYQRRAWRDAGMAIDEQMVQAILAVLACALGPLKLVELAHLIREIHGIDLIVSTDSLEPIRRFVIGDAAMAGYSFSHPKLADYFREEYFGGGEVIRQTRAGFLAWGHMTIRALNEGQLTPSEKPDYEYLLNHYSQHWLCLVGNGSGTASSQYLVDRAQALLELVDDGWRRAWEVYEGGFQGFADDVRAAWDAIRDAPLPPSHSLGAELRCALCLSSLHSLGSNMPTALLQAALAAGKLSWRQALHIAEFEIDAWPWRKPAKLAAAASAPDLPPEQRSQILAEALVTARAIPDAEIRVWSLENLAANLSDPERKTALAEALEAVRDIEYEWLRVSVLAKLAPHLPAELLAEAIEVACAFESERDRAQGLGALAPHLPPVLLAEALEAARATEEEWVRGSALRALIPHLAPDDRPAVVDEAFKTTCAGNTGCFRAEAIAELAPHLPLEHRLAALAKALEAVRPVESEWGNSTGTTKYPRARARALVALAPHLPPELLSEALKAARTGETECDRALALAAIAPHLPVQEQPAVLDEALASAAPIGDEVVQDDGDDYRREIFASLAPQLPPELLTAAVEVARAIRTPNARAWCLIALVPHLPPESRLAIVADVLEDARAVSRGGTPHRDDCPAILSAVAPYLSPELLAEALNVALAIKDTATASEGVEPEADRARAIAGLAPHLPPKKLAEAIAAVRAFGSQEHRGHALGDLAPHLPPNLLVEALSAGRSVGDERARARALYYLALHLPEGQRSAILVEGVIAARSIGDERERARVLQALAAHLPAEQSPAVLAEALKAVLAIDAPWNRAKLLAVLAPDLPAELLTQAIEAGRSIAYGNGRALALGALAARLPPQDRSVVLAEALKAVDYSEGFGGRHACLALAKLATCLSPAERPAIFAQALEAARAEDNDLDTAYAFDDLASYLSPALLAEALEASLAMEYMPSRAMALRALAPHLPPKLLAEALVAARTIVDKGARALAVSALTPHIGVSAEIPQATKATTVVKKLWQRASRIIARNLPEAKGGEAAPPPPCAAIAEALNAVPAIEHEWDQVDALGALAPRLPPKLLAEAIEVAHRFNFDHYRAQALAALAPRLPPELLRKALEVAYSIRSDGYRAQALSNLVPHLPPEQRVAVLQRIAEDCARAKRGEVLEAITTLAPVLKEIGGEALIQETARAISDVGRWWP